MHTSKSTLKSRFFPKLFSIPLICWTIFFLVVMLIPDDPGEEPLTWLDFFEATLFFTVIWFIISFMIAFIVNKIRKPVPDTPMPTAQTNIERSANDKCLYTCETVMNVDEYKKMVHYFPQTYWAFVMRGTHIKYNIYLNYCQYIHPSLYRTHLFCYMPDIYHDII